jgi:hypothetical protein
MVENEVCREFILKSSTDSCVWIMHHYDSPKLFYTQPETFSILKDEFFFPRSIHGSVRSFSNHFIAVSTSLSYLNVSCKMIFASSVFNDEVTSASPALVVVVVVVVVMMMRMTSTMMLWEEPLNCGSKNRTLEFCGQK